jgi:hypothetical protein
MEYFDEADTTFYEAMPVLYIEEKIKGNEFKTDMRMFIVYDQEDNYFYVYGSRKCKQNNKYINYMLKYASIDTLYNYIQVAMNSKYQKINVTGYFITGLTSADTFDDFTEKISNYNQLFGYDKVTLNRKLFNRYLNTLNNIA